MNTEEYRKWMEEMGFNIDFKRLIEISVKAGMLTGAKNNLSDSYAEFVTPFLEQLSSTDDLLQATFVRSGKKNPSEYRWLQSCIILLSEALKSEEEKIIQLAQEKQIIPAMVYLAIAILVKDNAIDGGRVTTSNSREVDYNYLQLAVAV